MMKRPSAPEWFIKVSSNKTSARALAGKIIYDVLAKPIFSNQRLSELLDSSDLAPRDRGFCTELVYGTLRWKVPLEESLRAALNKPGKIPPKVLAHCLVAAYQLQHLGDTIPTHAAVNEAVSLVKRVAPGLSGLTNAILRRLGSRKDHILVFENASSEEIARAFGLPIVLVETIQDILPNAEWQHAIEGLKERPKIYLRDFSKKESLSEDVKAHSFVPNAYSKESAPNLTQTLKGHLVVQDPASQVAALLLKPSVGQNVLDMCAAPGMKSLILKSLVGSSGKVVSVDINSGKKDRMIANMRRLGLPLDIKIADARNLAKDEKLLEKFDCVMLDAPCSGLGTIRRHPEIAIRYDEESESDTTRLQQELLTSASRLVKPGGVLVYSVCSPIESEGRDQIEWFLAQHKGFIVEDPLVSCPWLPADAITNKKFVALWPHRHDSDAFFAVRLVKR